MLHDELLFVKNKNASSSLSVAFKLSVTKQTGLMS